MATATLHPARRSFSRFLFRLLLGMLVLLPAGTVFLAAWFTWAAKSALPQLDGSLAVSGLEAPVTVILDQHGVPQIVASNAHDLFFAQGYVTAQDRLWEMDVTRRLAGGELAEILGPSMLKQDRQQRILRLRRVAEAAVSVLPQEQKDHLEAYAAGVNTYIAARRGRLPIEFRVLRYSPRPWTIADSILVGANMSEMLNLGYARNILYREKIKAEVGPELAADLYPTASWRDHPPAQAEQPLELQPSTLPDESRSFPSGEIAAWLAALRPQAEVAEENFIPGSNNWALSGAHTASGKPLLANDMHLQHHIPNVWYEAHLTCAACATVANENAGLDVAGVTLPGLPYVISGHNRRIAWGFTNLNPSVIAFKQEEFNSAGQYLTPQGWLSPENDREVIHVRGKADVVVNVVVTRDGPIVTELSPGETRKLALDWVLYDPVALQVPFYDIDSAGNWDEFCRAISHFASPAQNVVYADVDGHIGYHASGLVPLRRVSPVPPPGGSNPQQSAAANPGDTSKYIPFEQLPSVLDPESGVVATANSRVTPDGYPYMLAEEWMSPYRIQRIYRVLQSGKKFTSADMLSLQLDAYSDFDRFVAEQLVYAVDHSHNASVRARQAADLLRSWNGVVSAEAAAPSVEQAALNELKRMLLESRLGAGSGDPANPAGWEQYRWEMWPVWLENVLVRRPQRWLPPRFSSYNDLLTAAVEAAVSGRSAPPDLTAWRWGEMAAIYLQHPLFGRIPWLNRYSGPGRRSQSGNRNTVKQVGQDFGPSERLIVDFSDLDNSNLNIVTGQSGQIFSPYYMDQWAYWYEGKSFALPFSAGAVEKARTHELKLEPGK